MAEAEEGKKERKKSTRGGEMVRCSILYHDSRRTGGTVYHNFCEQYEYCRMEGVPDISQLHCILSPALGTLFLAKEES